MSLVSQLQSMLIVTEATIRLEVVNNAAVYDV